MEKPRIEDVLRPAKNISGRPSYICPQCGNGSGPDGTGITEDPRRPGHYHCFKCGLDGDVYDIMDAATGKAPGESYREAYSAAETARPAQTPRPQEKPKTQRTHDTQRTDSAQNKEYIDKCAAALRGSPGEPYLYGRGFSPETIQAYSLGYDAQIGAVVIPYPGADYYITRSTTGKKYRKPAGVPEPIFNEAALASDVCFIVEGQLDALSIIQAGGRAVAIGGAGDRKLTEYAGELPDVAVIVADNDAAGESTAVRVRTALEARGVSTYIVHPPQDCKDANEILIADGALLQTLVKGETWKTWEYAENSSAAAYARNFWHDAMTKTPATPTGFKKLDDVIDGGIYEGLYILGAVSSLGKTTFCLQLADQIARTQEQDVIVFSLEMARSELIAKSLSRLSLELCGGQTGNAKTARAITDPERIAKLTQAEKDLMYKATETYKEYGRHIWINEGLGTIGTKEIRQTVAQHIEATGRRPCIFIDYLQIVASPDPRLSDKQATDRNVFELKRISREYKIPVVAVSSFNRDNYTAALNMAAFKESGAIEYSSDVLIGLQPQGMTDKGTDTAKADNARTLEACKRAPTRQIELKILKNRNGKTGETISYQYVPMFNYFQET